MDQFPPGKPLAGWDILGSRRGKPFHDPAEDSDFIGATPPSPKIKAADLSLQMAFDFAEKAITSMNPPRQTKTKVRQLRELHTRLFKRDVSRK